MAPLTTGSARDPAQREHRLRTRVAHIVLAIAIEITLAMLHLPSEVHTGVAVALHLVAEMLH